MIHEVKFAKYCKNLLQVENFSQARDCLLPMGLTSENVAQRYGVTRQEQDQAAVRFIHD